MALCAVAFSQAGGMIVADTKLDLVLDPAGFLSRSLQAWDPQAAFGQVQNQAYGYLWPMGPFFLAGHAAALPGWIVQRLWWCLILVVAYTGMLALLRVLRIGSPTSRLLAALLFALSPRILTTLGAISVESWPTALVPWILVPLVIGSTRGSPRRWAAASALVVACLGGVNATASAVALVVPFLFLLTRSAGPRRRSLLLWWSGMSLLAVTWWLAPLLVMSRYSYPFLAYIESATTTTAPLSMVNDLRGTEHWVGFLVLNGVPSWPAGWWLSTSTLAIFSTTVVAAIGLLGVLARSCSERRFLRLSLLAGVVSLGVGYLGALGSPVAPWVHVALDGWAAPLRNVHKVDVLLRLPLCVGVAVVLPLLAPWMHRVVRRAYVDPDSHRSHRAAALVAAALVVLPAVAVISPALRGGLAQAGSFEAVPPAWEQAADWLAEHGPDDRTLLLPASNFGEYAWGHPRDELMQALAASPWGIRNIVPLGAPGLTRWLDAVQQEVAAGAPSSRLAAALREAGVRFVLLRADLDPASGVLDPRIARAAVSTSAGLVRVAAFGDPIVPTETHDVVGGAPSPQLEVYEVTAAAQRVSAFANSSLRAFSGGPEALVTSGIANRVGPWVAWADTSATGSGLLSPVVTDTLRRRVINVGAQRGSDYTPTLPASTPVARGSAAGDISPWPAGTDESSLTYAGIDGVTASSSAADPFAVGYLGPDRRPFSALDGDQATAWVTAGSDAAPWWEVTFAARAVSSVRLRLRAPEAVLAVRVITDTSSTQVVVGDLQRRGWFDVAIPPGSTTRLRVELDLLPRRTSQSGLAEVVVPGLAASESVHVATAVSASGAVFTVSPGARRSCVTSGDGWACAPSWRSAGEEVAGLDRTFETTGPLTMRADVLVRALPGPALDALLDEAAGYSAKGSSVYVDDAAARPGAALDADQTTAWVPAATDTTPRLDISYSRPVVSTGLRVSDGLATGRAFDSVVVTAGGRTFEVPLVDGVGTFAPVVSSTWRFALRRAPGPAGRPAAVRIQVQLDGAPSPTPGQVRIPCGSGPAITLDGAAVPVSLTAGAVDILRGGDLVAAPCGSGVVSLTGPGTHRLRALGGQAFAVTSISLLPPSGPRPGAVVPLDVAVSTWSPENRTFTVPAGEETLVELAEGFNAGWRATSAGVDLEAVRLDGWRQAWRVPASSAPRTVEASYAPGTMHRLALALGALLLVVVLVSALLPGATTQPAARVATGRRWEALGLSLLVPALVSGVAGLLVGALVISTRRLLGPTTRAVSAAGFLVLASVIAALTSTTWGPSLAAGVVQLLSVGTVALLALSAFDDPGSEPTRAHAGENGPLDDHPGGEPDGDAAHERQ